MSECLMTLQELCERLRCKESWARAQLEARRWPITWVANSYRFSADDYRKILQILSEPAVQERAQSPRRQRAHTASGKRPLKA